MKKILSIVLCLSVLSGLLTVHAEGENTEAVHDDYQREISVFSYIGMISDDSMIDFDKKITRAEFADHIAKFYGENYGEKKKYYRDVPIEHWAANSINLLVDKGFLTMNAEATFAPDRIITLGEACKILLCATGYETMADMSGGFANGYVSLAQMKDIVPEIKNPSELTYGEAYKLIFEALAMPVYVKDGNEYGVSADDSLFSIYHDIYVDEGIITAVYGASLDNERAKGENEIFIDSEQCYIAEGVTLGDNFGDYTEYVYVLDDEDKYIIHTEKIESKNDELLINSWDITAFDLDTYTLSYNKDSTNREKSETLKRGIKVIYNGSFYDGNLSGIFDEFIEGKARGSVKLKSYGDSDFDTVIIRSYRSIVVGYVSDEKETFHNIYDINDVVDIREYKNVRIMDAYGGETTITTATPQVISVSEAKDKAHIDIVPCMEVITGKIEQMTDNFITVGGKEYEIDMQLFNNISVTIGSDCNLTLDKFGYVVRIETAVDGYNIGYLTKILYNPETEKLSFRIYGNNGVMDTYISADKIRVDGALYNYGNVKGILDAIPTQNGSLGTRYESNGDGYNIYVSRQVIRYKINADKNIYEVDTFYCSKNEDSDRTLRRDLDGSKSLQYCHGPRRFGYDTVWFNGKTIAFSVPKADDNGKIFLGGVEINDDASLYSAKATFDHDIAYTIESYYYNPDNLYADIIVSLSSSQKEDYRTVIVDEVIKSFNMQTEEVVNTIKGYRAGAITDFYSDIEVDVSDLKKGDIIKIATDALGTKIISYKKLFDSESEKFVNQTGNISEYWYTSNVATGIPAYTLWRNSEYNLVKLYADEITSSIIKATYEPGGDEGMSAYLQGSIIVYDKENNRVEKGTYNSIKSYKQHGGAASLVILPTRRGGMDYIYIIN